MKKQLEIATFKANSPPFQGAELYWLFSRKQLEFVFREVEIFSSPPYVAAARYREIVLPVISLEKYYGLEEKDRLGSPKYLVVRSVDDQKQLVKLIVQMLQPLKIAPLASGPALSRAPSLPQNREDVLGMYSLATGMIGIVPDFAAMNRSLQQRPE
jgi:hypothetical protein